MSNFLKLFLKIKTHFFKTKDDLYYLLIYFRGILC